MVFLVDNKGVLGCSFAYKRSPEYKDAVGKSLSIRLAGFVIVASFCIVVK